jgi:hypothetical protein
MSLYNMVFGQNPSSNQLLEVLGLTEGDFGRFRDVYVADGCIVVHTRCGGGNREDYQWVFDAAQEHPWYSHDADNDFDCTYADIHFRVPDDKMATFVGLLNRGHNPDEQWKELFDLIGKK